MTNLKLALRSLLRKGHGNFIKIICLATGLALGLTLIAKVCFIDAFNSCFPARERIYRITSFPNNGERIVTGEGNTLSARIFCGDTDFFRVFGTGVVSGEPERILAQNGQVMVSRSLAEKLDGKPSWS